MRLFERVNFEASVPYPEGTTLCGPPFVAKLIDGVRCTIEAPELKERALCEDERFSPCPLFSLVSAKVLDLLAGPWFLVSDG